uniref:PEHE domain-containing protein n=1 Tax=Knipowitschia caucasica TaxID=637954 RepID=A0AAV2LHX5_KNICA
MGAAPACYMESSCGFKHNADGLECETRNVGTSTVTPVILKRECCDFVIDVHGAQGGAIPNQDVDQNYMTSKVAIAGTIAEAVQGNHTSGGVLSPVRQMGGEGTPVKGKPLSVDNMDNPKDAGADDGAKGVVQGVLGSASIEVSSEGKWRNIRKSPSNPQAQANCLRQILLLQLDLIEQQQQQLQSKDKEIDELKADKETLLARIERMERRLQLTRKDGPRDKRLFQPLEPWTPDKEDIWDLDVEETPQPNPPTQLNYRCNRGQKRKSCFGDLKRELRSKETPEKMFRCGTENDMVQCKEDPELSCEMEDLPFMSTTEMYLCCWNQPPLSPLRETSPKKEEEVASESTPHVVHDMLIIFPSWRENHIEPLEEDPSFIPPEVLDDNTFLKRHSKLELDEKRRKRWDIQRIREQRMFHRLQQRMNKKKVQESEPELSSFYPETEDVEAIVITPFLPVVAFGRPLPKLAQQHFELPWLDDKSRCRIEVPKKQTPHRTCRK